MKKQKSIWIMTLAALALTSCSNDAPEVVESANTSKLVSFRTINDKTETKATPTDIGNLSNMTMNAFTNSGDAGFDFLAGMPVVKGIGASGWAYAPEKYWPNANGNVHFFAYSPAGSRNVTAITPIAGGKTSTINYTVPTVYSAGQATQEDFLVAAKSVATSPGATYAAVPLAFTHALSMATFQAENKSSNMTFVVESIQLINLDNTGLLTITPDATTSTYVWSANAAYNQTYAASLPAAGVPLMPDAGVKSLTSANEGLMILPQDLGSNAGAAISDVLPADIASSKSYILVSYRTIDPAGIVVSGLTRYFPLAQVFVKSNQYAFQFSFDAGSKVSFNVTVGSWTSGTPTIINP